MPPRRTRTEADLQEHRAWVTLIDTIGNEAVREAQRENRLLGIPNGYQIGNRIISDQQLRRMRRAVSTARAKRAEGRLT